MRGTKVKQLQKTFTNQIKQASFQGWITCRQTIQAILMEQPQLSLTFQSDILYELSAVGNLLTLLLLYSHKIKQSSFRYIDRFEALLKKQDYQDVLKWITSQKSQIQQQSIELILQNLTHLLKNSISLKKTRKDVIFLLKVFNRFQVKRERDINTLMNFMGLFQQIQLSGLRQEIFQNKQMIIMQICCEILASSQPTTGNLGLIFDDFLIDHQSRSLQRFINQRSDFLLELGQNDLFSIFRGLTKRSLSFTTLSFFYRLSQLLNQEEQYFKLRFLYEQFVLPDLSKRAKCCRKPKTQQTVLKICQFYVFGFLHHCKLNTEVLECLLSNIDRVQSKTHKSRWVALCSLLAEKQEGEVLEFFQNWRIKSQEEVDSRIKQKIVKQNQVFQVTTRSIRQKKTYRVQSSTLKGISNHGNQCYIISVVQALFTTKSLLKLMQQIFPRRYTTPNMYHLKQLFKELSSDKERLSSVDDLKADGPEQFAKSDCQEDAQNYLIRLFQKLQKQFKKQNALQKFKNIFEIDTTDTIKCYKCKYKTVTKQQEYTHTISHTHPFSLEYSQDLTDYSCPQCKNPQLSKTTELSLKGNILIVHINRFSVLQKQTRKQLPTQPIQRKIKNYELVGILFHIGKHIQVGHYTYYSRIDRKRWADMNDSSVKQFILDEEDEHFEINMKAEKTPYILFYKKV